MKSVISYKVQSFLISVEASFGAQVGDTDGGGPHLAPGPHVWDTSALYTALDTHVGTVHIYMVSLWFSLSRMIATSYLKVKGNISLKLYFSSRQK